MTSKLRAVLAGVIAAGVLTGGVLAASSASAYPNSWPNGNSGQWRQRPWEQRGNYGGQYYGNNGYYGGWGYDNGVGPGILGFIAGAFVGTALSHSYDANSCYRFRTYNSHTGMYMSFNGPRHCP